MAQYALPRHVFVCLQGEHVVFLDVRKDRYFALEAARTAGLGEWVAGWPVAAPIAGAIAKCVGDASVQRSSVTIDDAALAPVISLLLEKEILTTGAEGKPATLERAEALRGELSAEALDEQPQIGAGRLFNFASAAIRARLLLKHRTFGSVIDRVRSRIEANSARAQEIDEPRLYDLVAAFAFLRPYFFAAKDACLFDALALSEYLAAYRVYPHWVFGVQARPFAAHCWLQLNGVVLNDTADHVQRYAPIMTV